MHHLKLLPLLLLLASSAQALDTLEPFVPGMTDVELYSGLSGLGEDHQSVSMTGILGAGLTDRISTLILWSASADENLASSGSITGLGLFANLFDQKHVDFDLNLGAEWGGGAFALLPGFELNLDAADKLEKYGLYFRFIMPLSNEPAEPADPADPADTGKIAKAMTFNPGFYYSIGGGQILAEYRNTTDTSFDSETSGHWGLGFNYLIKNIDVIMQVGMEEGAFDIGLGLLATVP